MSVFSKKEIDEIKSQNDIVDVIGSYIVLNAKNAGLCPFHNDHHASLTIHPEKQIFTCWSCGATGNVIKFVEMIEGCRACWRSRGCARCRRPWSARRPPTRCT